MTCTNCTSLPALIGVPVLARHDGPLQLVCTHCPTFSLAADAFPVLTTAGAQVTLTCTDCPALVGVEPSVFPAIAVSDAHLDRLALICNGCGTTFNASFPLAYTFTGATLPALGAVAQGASIAVVDVAAAPATFLNAFASVTRLLGLSFQRVHGLTTLDAIVSLQRVDGTFTVESCPDLTSMDGATVALQLVALVAVVNNSALCRIDEARLRTVATFNPVIKGNGGAACTPLQAAVPGPLAVVGVSATAISLTWPATPQPTVAVSYTLSMNGVALVSFPSYRPQTLPYLVSPLSPAT